MTITPIKYAIVGHKVPGRDIWIESRGLTWSVFVDGYVLTKQGELEREPLPNKRTTTFINRARHDTLEDALHAFEQWQTEHTLQTAAGN